MTRPGKLAAGAALTVLALSLGACGDDGTQSEPPPTSATSSDHSDHTPSPTASGSPSASASETASGTRIPITFEGSTVTPNGEVVQAKVGEEITLVVTADAPGEIHVHSTPEQELEYGAGTTTLTLTIDRPGSVDVESHDLEIVIVKLEVR